MSTFVPMVLAACVCFTFGSLIWSFALLTIIPREMRKRGPDGAWLRVEGHTLHGRIVYVDRIGWEREIARWGLDSNGCMTFDQHTDHTLYTGYVIEGPDDVAPELKTAAGAPWKNDR